MLPEGLWERRCPAASRLLPQHSQVVDDHSAKKVRGVLKCYLQLVHFRSRYRKGVSTAVKGNSLSLNCLQPLPIQSGSDGL